MSKLYEKINDFYTSLGEVDFKARVKEEPYCKIFYNGQFVDNISYEGKINYDGLNDHQKLCLYVYAWNTNDILPGRKGILKKFGWTNYKLQKIIKELKGAITTDATFSEETGLLNGRGYFFKNPSILLEQRRKLDDL